MGFESLCGTVELLHFPIPPIVPIPRSLPSFPEHLSRTWKFCPDGVPTLSSLTKIPLGTGLFPRNMADRRIDERLFPRNMADRQIDERLFPRNMADRRIDERLFLEKSSKPLTIFRLFLSKSSKRLTNRSTDPQRQATFSCKIVKAFDKSVLRSATLFDFFCQNRQDV